MVTSTAKIGQIVFGKGSDILGAITLGSCMGVVLYDEVKKITTMAYVALPSIDPFPRWKKNFEISKHLGRYANTAIPASIEELKAKGADRARIRAKIVQF